MSRIGPAGDAGTSESRTESALGARLRAARESRGLSVESAGREAGIPLRYLQMLEEGEFPTVADPAYLTHFLRRYARFLGLDAEASARDFLSETEPESTARRTGRIATSVGPKRRAPIREPLVPGWAAYALVLIAGLAGLFTFVRMQQEREAESQAIEVASRPLRPPSTRPSAPGGEGTVSVARAPRETVPQKRLPEPPAKAVSGAAPEARVATRPESPPAAPAVVAGAPPAAPERAPAAEEAAPPADVREATNGEPATRGERASASRAPGAAAARSTVNPVAEPEPEPAEADEVRPPFELRLTATSRQVWIWVSVDGGPREAISLDEGQTVVFRAERRYVLSIDDAGGIAGSLNGKPLPSFGADAQARRNVVIPSAEFGGAATSRG